MDRVKIQEDDTAVIIVDLEPSEINVCHILGRLRSLIARGHGVADRKMGPQDGSEADVLGVMAEYAFAKWFNTFPDFGLSPRSGSRDGLLKGYSYDIKATKYKSGKLLATTKINPDVDLYVLCVVDAPTVTICGYALKDELIREENLCDLGHGAGYALDQDQLRLFRMTDDLDPKYASTS